MIAIVARSLRRLRASRTVPATGFNWQQDGLALWLVRTSFLDLHDWGMRSGSTWSAR
jgi:hypothetical protein